MPPGQPDHPLLLALGFVTALPFGWAAICAFARSADEDFRDAAEYPLLSFLGWFPEWTLLKLCWLAVVLVALTITFYNGYLLAAEWLGLL